MQQQKNVYWIVIIAALGYFVDIYDLILYNVIKEDSLASIGITGEAFKACEHVLFNWQMFGMMLGGLLWGIMGDKKGRISVLFGSILLYSLANIANGFVQSMNQYIICRFIAGIGLAGELGAGITLVSETMHKDKRGIGTMIIVSFGALGAVAASLVGKSTNWQNAYFIGGGLGIALLAMRAGALESGMYKSLSKNMSRNRGNFFFIFKNKQRTISYLKTILIGVPIWFIIGVLINLSADFVHLEGAANKELVGQAVMFAYIGLSAGDLVSGVLSQWFRSRKKVIYIYLIASVIIILFYLFEPTTSFNEFRLKCFLLGAGTGYWALFVQVASESFGTNIRSTVTNTVPNFVRGLVVPITLSFKWLKGFFESPQQAALVVGGICLLISFISISLTKETFSEDLDYIEE